MTLSLNRPKLKWVISVVFITNPQHCKAFLHVGYDLWEASQSSNAVLCCNAELDTPSALRAAHILLVDAM